MSLICILFLAIIAVCNTAPAGDKITSLPGANFTIKFDQYSGYLAASDSKLFHYWFVYSQQNPVVDPLILWLNGGPGCSSLDGLIEELGPFKVADNGNTVFLNKYSWNTFASVLFVESPAGVGFSIDTNGNIATSDDEVATNNYNALVDFFKKFPEFRFRPLYITGESYAGVYLPMLGVKIAADKTNFPMFKGMAVGNGAVNFPNNYATMVPIYYYHSLVRQELWDNVRINCCNGDMLNCDIFGLFSNATCRGPVIEILDGTNDLDEYNLYSTCYLDSGSSTKRNTIKSYMRRLAGLPQKGRNIKNHASLPLCAQVNNTQIYLNRADVRKALHIPSIVQPWQECSDPVTNAYQTTHFDMSPEFNQLTQNGIRVLVYNGDVDTVCNHMMNRNFLNNLNRTILGPEQVNKPWFFKMETPNVGGFVTQYSGDIDFVTIRGSGHFVPEDKPREALQVIYNWLHGVDYSEPVPFV